MAGVRLYNPDANPTEQVVFSASAIATGFGTYQALARDGFVRYTGRFLAWLGDGYIWEMFAVNSSGTGRSGRVRLFALANVTSMVAGLDKVWFVDTGELVYNWNGVALTTTTDPSVTCTQPLLAYFNEDIYLIYDQSSAGAAFMKKFGTGNWGTSYNTPATLTNWQPACWKVYKNNLYIGGVGTVGGTHEGIILKFDGTNVTVVNELVATDVPASGIYAVGCTSMAVQGGVLYYVSQGSVSGTVTTNIGTFDNSTWTDDAIDFLSAISSTQARIGKLYSFKNRLLVGVAEGSDSPYLLYGSAIGNPAGTYTALSSEQIVNGGVWDILPR